MTTIDYAARLALVQAAIDGLLSGKHQSYEIDGMKVTKLELKQLTDLEAQLVARIARTSGSRRAFRTGVPR